ncbi:MAG: hypothetical protein IPG04_10160 [Polyangiaceae bacterium]|nr:hypothetical protein [Polyangiaceae bacterium]
MPGRGYSTSRPAPGTLLLAFGGGPESCADPLAALPACEPTLSWRAEIPLPAELQFAGASVDLAELQGVGYGLLLESQSEGRRRLLGRRRRTPDGHLEVLAIDGQNVTIRLTNTNVLEAPIDGERTLLRCGGDDPPPATALARPSAARRAL